MCESVVGVVNPATRQNCGSPVSDEGGVVGVTNVPAGTVCASVMVVFARWNVLARFEQESALAGVTAKETVAANATAEAFKTILEVLEPLSKRVMLSLP